MTIIPAILGATAAEVKEKLLKVVGQSEWVHIDVVDGKFAEPESWHAPLDLWEIIGIPKVELHLMVADPMAAIPEWVNSPIDRMLFHVESQGDKRALIEKIKKYKMEPGLVLKLETDISAADPYLRELNVIQLMSIAHIGAYGAPFDERVLAKVKALRYKWPGGTIAIDGGVNKENIAQLRNAGASSCAVGSAIFGGEDIVSAIKYLGGLSMSNV